MATVFLQLVGKVDYADGFEWAFFDTDTASTTELFAD